MTAVPSSRVRTEASKQTASTKSRKLGNAHTVARNCSKETPPIRNGTASIGNRTSKSPKATSAALNSLLAKTSVAPRPLRNNRPSVCSRRSSAKMPAVSRGVRSTR